MQNVPFIPVAFILLGSLALMFRGRRTDLTIYSPNVGLLYRNGRFERQLGPGRHTFWAPAKNVHIVHVSGAAQRVSYDDLTVISGDQFSFRMTISLLLEIGDARLFGESQGLIDPCRHPTGTVLTPNQAGVLSCLSAAAVQAVSRFNLQEILKDPQQIAKLIEAELDEPIPGLVVNDVSLTSITLPPEIRRMLTDVERSRFEAQAALERARSEQAALRALANAARLVNDNPALGQLRLLQTLEKTPGPKTIVMGGVQSAFVSAA